MVLDTFEKIYLRTLLRKDAQNETDSNVGETLLEMIEADIAEADKFTKLYAKQLGTKDMDAVDVVLHILSFFSEPGNKDLIGEERWGKIMDTDFLTCKGMVQLWGMYQAILPTFTDNGQDYEDIFGDICPCDANPSIYEQYGIDEDDIPLDGTPLVEN